MQKVSDVISMIEANKGNMEFLKTGFPTVDEKLDGGFLKKELVILGGKTGIGKSYIASQILFNIVKQGFKTAYFSLEISNEMVVSRLLGSIANIKSTRVRAGLLNLLEVEQLATAKGKIGAYEDYLSFYDDLYEYKDIEKEIIENKYEFIVIDFIQNIFAPSADEYQKLSKIALDLQKLAKTTNSCILALSQLSNAVAREGIESTNLEYKGSGSIQAACDLGFLVERSFQNDGLHDDEIKFVLKKNRRGVGYITFPLVFHHPGGFISEQYEQEK